MRILRRPAPAACGRAIALGSFDGVHRGHQAIMAATREAATARGLESAALTFEPLPRECFDPAGAPARITSLAEKLARLAETGLDVALVERFDRAFAALAPADFERRLAGLHGARWVMAGEDFRYGSKRGGDVESLRRAGRALGFDVEVLPEVTEGGERISSTRVREALAEGDFDRAARLLGRAYGICGRVVHGAKLGRTLGFPTANLRLARPRAPLHGVYAVRCFGAATRGLEGVASLGSNPAVRVGGPATLEAYLFDFSGDLYGARLTLEFVKKLRDEAHFASIDALAAQIQRDCDAARRHFAAMRTG